MNQEETDQLEDITFERPLVAQVEAGHREIEKSSR
jgi:hypothetical protein